jgi:cellobiose phosphorylase
VLDPVLALRRVVEIAPRATARFELMSCAAFSREEAIDLALRLSGPGAFEASRRLAEAAADAEGVPLGIAVEAPPAQARPGAPSAKGDAASPAWARGGEPLRCFNGTGGFSAGGDEYVIRMPQGSDGRPRLTPRPWINVLANPGFGALISESGAGYTWTRNSRELRLTPWTNDPVRDPHHEALYLRDEENGQVWSAFAGPIPGDGPYEMRHGFGFSRCRHASAGLEVETEVFVHACDPVKVVQVTLTNPGPRPRTVTVTAYQRLVLGPGPERAAGAVTTSADDREAILFARLGGDGPYQGAVAFAAPVVGGTARWWTTTDRETFLGPGGSPARPRALLVDAGSDDHAGSGTEPCFAIRVPVELPPGESRSCAFLLGEAPNREAIEAMVRRLRQPGAVARALEDVKAEWADRLGRVRVETPSESLDPLVNGWLAYQTLACRMWGRSAFYQSGGAYGFRDQLQDAAAFLAIEPRLTREQILLHAAHQFVEGDVLHWWHPAPGLGIRTRFADDLLWLPYVTAAYVRSTGDAGVLAEPAPFLEGPAPGPHEDEIPVSPVAGAITGDVYDHCCRAIERSLATGAHGLPLFGTGDWNDGMNRVGREGRGESVWMGFFLHAVIEAFIPCCETRGDSERVSRWREHQGRLAAALESAGWDGEWYRRGFYDDGSPLGSRESDECRIDALVQAWSVLSGAAPRARCEQALDAVERQLVDEEAGLIRLLTPPFDRTPHDPGYIKGYLPGVRENGGQYTHAALWVVGAMAALGGRDRAARLLEMLSPVTHARTPEEVARYQVEPYVVAADVCGNPEHLGSGGWTWYTGSAGWMLRVALESVLGVTLEGGNTLVIRAAIPSSWPGFRMRLRPWGRTGVWSIEVRNGSAEASTVVSVTLDGRSVEPEAGEARLPVADDGREHRVQVVLGKHT